MQRISVYIPEDTKKRINLVASSKSKAEAEVIREALDKGLKIIYPPSSSAQALLDLAKMAEKIPTKGKIPKDFIKNLDYYTWGGEKHE
jgi:predicted DNA-binding protein